MTCISGHGVTVGNSSTFQNAVELVCSSKACDKENTKVVHYRLDNHSTDKDDSILKGYRVSEIQELGTNAGIKSEVIFFSL